MLFSSDRGGEFLSVKLQQYLKREGILHQLAPARTPQHNAISERANRTIGEMSQALRIYANLPYSYWGYARKYAAFIRNRCPTKSNPGFRTPFEIRYGKKPDLSSIRIFGSPCFAFIKKQDRQFNQLADKAVQATFVGISELDRAYMVIPDGMRVAVLTRSVVFDELRACEKAKHIIMAHSLSYAFEVPKKFSTPEWETSVSPPAPPETIQDHPPTVDEPTTTDDMENGIEEQKESSIDNLSPNPPDINPDGSAQPRRSPRLQELASSTASSRVTFS
jgi:hypothetical protein